MHNSLLNIQNELEKARERLKGVEETIKKSIGRDINNSQTPRPGFKRTVRHLESPQDGANDAQRLRFDSGVKNRLGDGPWGPGGGQQTGHDFRGIRNNRNERFRGGNLDERIPAKKRLGEQTAVTVFSRLSGPPKDDEYEEKESVKITSQVIVQDTPSRKEVLAAQAGDNLCRARNRRMFGALIGHIQKFRQEENRLKEKERKKAEVEKKVEEAALREKEELKKKRQELFTSRRQQQQEIRQLEYKLMRMKQLTDWESTRKHLVNFIQTNATPKIFYLPKNHNEKTKTLLEESRQRIMKMIQDKRAEVERSIADHGKRSWKVNNEPSPSKKQKVENNQDIEDEGGENINADNEDISSMDRTVEAAELADDDEEEEMAAAAESEENIELAPVEEAEEDSKPLEDEDVITTSVEEMESSITGWGTDLSLAPLNNDRSGEDIENRTDIDNLLQDLGDNGSISDKENLLDIQPPLDDPPPSTNLQPSVDDVQSPTF